MVVRFPPRHDVLFDELLAARAREIPDRVFVVFEDGEEWTFEQTAREAWETANALRDLGVREGDFVSMWFPGGKLGVRMLFGVLAAGGVFAPLNTAYRGGILEHALNVTGSRLLVAHADVLPRLEGLDVPHLEQIVAVGPGAGEIEEVNGIPSRAEPLRGPADKPLLEHPREPWDHMCLMFTSGTTGPSKGVLQSALFYDTFCHHVVSAHVDERDRYFGLAPIFHNGWPLILGGMLRVGGSVYVTDSFNARTFWRDARRHGITATYLVGGMAMMLLRQPEHEDDRNHPMRLLTLAPNLPDAEQLANFRDRFGVHPNSGYGSTEIGFPMTTAAGEWDTATSGTPFPGYELRVVDDFDQEVEVGDVGMLVVRHDRPWSLCSGYKDMPEATAELWRNGWLHTGDAFRVNDAGKYYFVDRMKDVIRRRGENISSQEIEKEAVKHPSLQRCAAFATTDESGDEEVMLTVQLADGVEELDPAELAEFLVERLPHFTVPRFIDIVDEMPLTATERVQKGVLRAGGRTPTTWDREEAGMVLKPQKLAW